MQRICCTAVQVPVSCCPSLSAPSSPQMANVVGMMLSASAHTTQSISPSNALYNPSVHAFLLPPPLHDLPQQPLCWPASWRCGSSRIRQPHLYICASFSFAPVLASLAHWPPVEPSDQSCMAAAQGPNSCNALECPRVPGMAPPQVACVPPVSDPCALHTQHGSSILLD